MAEADPNEVEEKSGGGNKLIVILLAVLIVVILAVGATIAILLLGGDDDAAANGQETEQVEEEQEPLDPIHVSLGDSMTVNLADQSVARHLRIEIEVLTYNEEVAEILQTYNSQVRNDLMMMLSEVDVDEIRSRSGREALQQEVLDEINAIVEARADIEDGVEEVYFLQLLTQ